MGSESDKNLFVAKHPNLMPLKRFYTWLQRHTKCIHRKVLKSRLFRHNSGTPDVRRHVLEEFLKNKSFEANTITKGTLISRLFLLRGHKHMRREKEIKYPSPLHLYCMGPGPSVPLSKDR